MPTTTSCTKKTPQDPDASNASNADDGETLLPPSLPRSDHKEDEEDYSKSQQQQRGDDPPAPAVLVLPAKGALLPDYKDQVRSVVALRSEPAAQPPSSSQQQQQQQQQELQGAATRSAPGITAGGALPTFKDQVRNSSAATGQQLDHHGAAAAAAAAAVVGPSDEFSARSSRRPSMPSALGVFIVDEETPPPVAVVEPVVDAPKRDENENNKPSVGSEPTGRCSAGRRRWLWAGAAVLATIAVAGAVAGIILAANNSSGDGDDTGTSYAKGAVNLMEEIKGRNDGDAFGNFVILSRDGSTMAVGATSGEYVRAYHRDGSQWNQIGQTIKARGDTGRGGFGGCIALSKDGKIIAIGADSNDHVADNAGKVKVFYYDGSQWVQVGQDLNGSNEGDRFGWEVVLADDGNTLAVGARHGDPSSDREDAGYARVFSYNGDPRQSINQTWVQLGPDLEGEASEDQFGRSLAIDAIGRRLVVGAVTGAGEKGRIRVFDYSEGSWNLVGQALDGDNIDDWQGTSVSLSADGSVLAIAADGTDTLNGSNAGIVRVYYYDGSTWIQIGQNILGEGTDDQFGAGHISLSSDGTCLAIGSNHDSNRGKGYLYRWSVSKYVEVATVDGANIGDDLGQSSTVSGDCSLVAFGAPQKKTSGDAPGYIRIYQVV